DRLAGRELVRGAVLLRENQLAAQHVYELVDVERAIAVIGLCRGRFEDRNVELLAGEQGRDPELQLAFDPDVLVRGARKGGYTITGSRGPNRGRRGASTPGIPCMLMLMKPTERERKFWRVIAAALG